MTRLHLSLRFSAPAVLGTRCSHIKPMTILTEAGPKTRAGSLSRTSQTVDPAVKSPSRFWPAEMNPKDYENIRIERL